MKWNGRFRCALVCFAFIALFSLFSFRLVYLQLLKHDEYTELAAEKHVYKQTIYAERGEIFDANGEVLAHNVPVETIVADATLLNNIDGATSLLSAALKDAGSEVSEKLRAGRRYMVVKHEVPETVATALRDKLRAENVRGIYFERDSSRDLSEWLHALPCHRFYRLRASRHPGRRIFDGAISARRRWLPLHRA